MKKSSVSFMMGAAAVKHMRHRSKPSAERTARNTSRSASDQPYGTVRLQQQQQQPFNGPFPGLPMPSVL